MVAWVFLQLAVVSGVATAIILGFARTAAYLELRADRADHRPRSAWAVAQTGALLAAAWVVAYPSIIPTY